MKKKQNNFVMPKKANRKLQYAYEGKSAVYLYGATGFGKTRIVKEFVGEKRAIWLSAAAPEWSLESLYDKKSSEEILCVVVDDMHLLKSEERRQLIYELAERNDVWLLLLGRMQTPIWLVRLLTDGNLVVITESDLKLDDDEIKQIAKNENIIMNEAEAEAWIPYCQGNAYIVTAIIQLLKAGHIFDDNLKNKIEELFINHLETNIIPQWSMNLQEFLMQLSVVDEFTLQLAVMITGDDHASAMIEEAMAAGNFLIIEGEIYRIRPQLIGALRSRALKVFGVEKYNHYINNAGLYYETTNDSDMAIKLYEKAGNKEGIRSILIRNARRNPGAFNIYLLRKYYLELEEKDIESSVVLMSVMSLIYSIMMNTEKSEYWYEKLKNHAKTLSGGEKREADEQLIYLDIALPHRGSVDLVDMFKRMPTLVASGGIKLPEFTITANLPSIMNGAKDFCSWSKRDTLLADTIGKIVEKTLGSVGRGLIHAALCESFYEKGGKDDEVLRHAIMHQMEVDGGGKTEVLFASVGIQIRLNVLSGNLSSAASLLDSFEERAKREKLGKLQPSIDALRCRLALVRGDLDAAKEWLETAPDEQVEFWGMNRYLYLTKVWCYLTFGENEKAINLLERLLYYADVSKRTYIGMKSKLFMAIAMNQEKKEWKKLCLEALNEASEYSFVRVISENGAGILPLLREIKDEYLKQKTADKKWFDRVLKETKMVADYYPNYLVCDNVKPKDFTEIALKILKMQSEGLSIKEIAASLELSERTVKYHASENYRKLGAKGKTDAVQLARRYNLL